MEWKTTDVTILFAYCWISTYFGPTGPSSGEFIQLFTQPLVQCLCRSVRVLCMLWPVLVTMLCWHVEIQQYTNKIVTSVGFHSICPFPSCLLVVLVLKSQHPLPGRLNTEDLPHTHIWKLWFVCSVTSQHNNKQLLKAVPYVFNLQFLHCYKCQQQTLLEPCSS